VTLWNDRVYTAKGVESDEMCKGGIYLKPSKYRTIDRNTDITLKAISIDGNDISIYAFVIDNAPNFDGDWAEFLLSAGFEVSDSFPFATMAEGGFVGNWRSYYKTVGLISFGGENKACRGDHSGDNNESYYSAHNVAPNNVNECFQLCYDSSTCHGVEYQKSTGRCEVWNRIPLATANVDGYECYVKTI